MKTKLLVLPIFLFLFSCEAEGELTQNRPQEIEIPENVAAEFEGSFQPTSGINVQGVAKVYLVNNQYQVELENFSVSSGPDLKVYLSTTDSPSNFVNLGNLTSATIYAIPPQVDVSEYPFVLIHCQQYNHLFAIAPLTQN